MAVSGVKHPSVAFFPGPSIRFSMAVFHPLHQYVDIRVDIFVDIGFVPGFKYAYTFQDGMRSFFNFWLKSTYTMGSKLSTNGLDVPTRIFETAGCRMKRNQSFPISKKSFESIFLLRSQEIMVGIDDQAVVLA